MKATVDPDSAEGRAEIDRLQHQILQIYQSLRGRLRRENRASLKSQRAVLIQQLDRVARRARLAERARAGKPLSCSSSLQGFLACGVHSR